MPSFEAAIISTLSAILESSRISQNSWQDISIAEKLKIKDFGRKKIAKHRAVLKSGRTNTGQFYKTGVFGTGRRSRSRTSTDFSGPLSWGEIWIIHFFPEISHVFVVLCPLK